MPPKSRKRKHDTVKGSPEDLPGLADVEGSGANNGETKQSSFEVPCDGKSIPCQRYGSSTDSPGLVFTHGASGTLANPATKLFVDGFSRSTAAVCFQGTMNLQSRTKDFHAVINHEKADTAALGGRSLGARAAVLAAKDHETAALILVSYPLVGQNGDVRDQILLDVRSDLDVLFISGNNDNMCRINQLSDVRAKMKAKTWLAVVQGADHGMSLKPKDAVEEMRRYCGKVAAQWLQQRDDGLTECLLRWNAHARQVVDDGWKASATISVGGQDQALNPQSTLERQDPSSKRRKKD